MKVKTIKSFRDKKECVTRKMGDAFTVSKERCEEINSTKFGVLVVVVAEDATKPKKRPSKKE